VKTAGGGEPTGSWAPRAEQLLARARRLGAKEAEVFFAQGDDFTVRVHDGAVESLESSQSRGAGTRTFAEGKVGFAYGADLSTDGLASLLEEALRNGRYNQPDPFNGLPEPQAADPLTELFAPEFSTMDADRKVELALELETNTIGRTPKVRQIGRGGYSDGIDHVEIYNSRGLAAQFDRTTASVMVQAIAEDGPERETGYAFACGRWGGALDIAQVAREAVDRAVGLLGATPVLTARMPIVLDPLAAVSLLAVLAAAFSADAVQKERSLLAGKLGEAVAARGITLLDDGRTAAGMAARPWDGEGVPTQRTELVRDGVLRSYLFNTYTARKGGARSTGNAVRSYRSQPEVGATNLVLEPGPTAREDLLGEASGGLYVTDLAGLHTVNPASGDFSLGARGRRIEGGALGAPVRNVTIAGNVLNLLKQVRLVGSDQRWVFQVASPSLLVDDISVGGA
jgi:PmbA protein